MNSDGWGARWPRIRWMRSCGTWVTTPGTSRCLATGARPSPTDVPQDPHCLGLPPPGTCLVGTSGWTYEDWVGRFYPEDLPATARLEFYARHFPTVELNASFYRLPSPAAISSWNRRLPPHFHMVVKGWRRVTHLKKLVSCADDLAFFMERVGPLSCLRVVLWQLPPSLHRDTGRLEAFLGLLPQGPRHAVEFRHRSWWSEGVADLLSGHGVAWVAVSHPSLPDEIVPTTDFLYLRFHGLGPRLYVWDYSTEELARWADRLRPLLTQRYAYAFFNNDFQAFAVRNALQFARILSGTSRAGEA